MSDTTTTTTTDFKIEDYFKKPYDTGELVAKGLVTLLLLGGMAYILFKGLLAYKLMNDRSWVNKKMKWAMEYMLGGTATVENHSTYGCKITGTGMRHKVKEMNGYIDFNNI